MNDVHFLFGEEICRIYEEGGIADVIHAIKSGVGHATFVWKEDSDPTQLLSAYEGWNGWVTITEKQYEKIQEA